jgi:hypothetical protein
MAGSKKKKAHAQTRAKASVKRPSAKRSGKKTLQPAKKVAPAKKAVAKKAPAKTAPAKKAPAKKVAAKTVAARTFAEKVRDCDAGTGIWFITAGSVEHAAIQRRGGDGAVVIRTDAGVTELVLAGNVFETGDEARAARYR